VCAQVSMYGFGKTAGVQHHYHDTVHTVEYSKRADCCRKPPICLGVWNLAPVRVWFSFSHLTDVCVCGWL